MSAVTRKTIQARFDTAFDASLHFSGSASGWSVSEMDSVEGPFSWSVYARAMEWYRAAKTEPVEFRSFVDQEYDENQGQSTLILGVLPGFAYFGYYADGSFFGGTIAKATLNEILTTIESLK